MEKLIERGTELGDMELLSPEEKAEFTMLSEALDEYGRAYHPLVGLDYIHLRPYFLSAGFCNWKPS